MKKGTIIIAITILVLTVTTIIFQEPILQKIGDVLVYQGPLEPADAIVVLAGSGTGNRIKAGAHLFAKNFGKVMVITASEGYPGFNLVEFMQNYAIELGVPKNKIIAKTLDGEVSTWGEGIFNLRTLKGGNFNSFIVVTSAFHSNRAHAVYEKLIADLGYDFKFMVYPAKDNRIPIKGWWKTRVGKKHIFLEYLSTLNFYREH